MEYLYEYLVFLAEVVTLVIALLVIISAIAGASQKQVGGERVGRLVVAHINEQLKELRHTMEHAVLPKAQVKKQHKAEAKQENKAEKERAKALGASTEDTSQESADKAPERIFCLRFDGDIKASAVDHLRSEVSAVLTMATEQDEVVVVVESPGGMVSNYGLAASQLTRFRSANIPLTVVVDKVAASGGYLMAAVASKILAAPFALVGSIGVVAQVPNVHRLLKKNDVDVEVHTAGKHKRTLTMFGENTEEGRQKFKEELEDVHTLFQTFVAGYRPDLDMDTVATGEAWYGTRAVDIGLVDGIATSDEYLMAACEHSEVYTVKWEELRRPIDRLMERVNGMLKQAEDTMGKFTNNG